MQIRLCACVFVIIERRQPFMVVKWGNFVNDQSSGLHETNWKA